MKKHHLPYTPELNLYNRFYFFLKVHGKIGQKLKGGRCNSAKNIDSKGSNINSDLNKYVPK